MNLLYCGNQKIFNGILLSVLSALKHTNKPLKIYIMTLDLQCVCSNYAPIKKEQIDILDNILKQRNKKSTAILIDATHKFQERLGESKNINTAYTPYTLLRLISIMYDLPKYTLYIDADTMFSDDVHKIKDYDISKYEFAAVLDHLGKKFINKKYINAGVLYMNIEMIKKTKLFDKALHACLSNEMLFPDQDAINIFAQKILYLPRKFNEQHRLKKDTIIKHFAKTIYFFPIFKVINIKQWQINLVHKTLKTIEYDDIYQLFNSFQQQYPTLIEPLDKTPPMSFWNHLRYSFFELKNYTKQNGGIFRRESV